jgi:hypothetical protein
MVGNLDRKKASNAFGIGRLNGCDRRYRFLLNLRWFCFCLRSLFFFFFFFFNLTTKLSEGCLGGYFEAGRSLGSRHGTSGLFMHPIPVLAHIFDGGSTQRTKLRLNHLKLNYS